MTIKKLSMACKTFYNLLKECNCYKLMWYHQFAECNYYSWWTEQENCLLQQIGKMCILFWTGHSNDPASSYLIEYLPIYDFLFKTVSGDIHYTAGYSSPTLFHINMKQLKKWIILIQRESGEWNMLATCDTSENIMGKKR